MNTITYIYDEVTPSLIYTVDYSGESGKIVLEKNPFLIENEKVEGYKLNPSDATYAYYPLQLIDVPENDLTLYVKMVDAGLVQVKNEGLPTKDISGMILNVVQKKGKNQPFSYIVLTVSRQLFIDADITMVQKQTKFKLNIYGITGDWIYERLEDNGSYYDITLVNRAYYLKNITLLSLFNFTFTYQDENNPPVTHTDDTKIGLTNLGFVYVDAQHDYRIELNDQDSDPNTKTYWVNNEASFTIPFDGKSLTVSVKRNTYTTSSGQQTDYSLTKISNAKPDDIFYFLAKYVAGYGIQDIDIQDGFYYTGILTGNTFNIHDKYTMSDIEDLKVGKTTIPANNTTFNSVSIRLDEFCWDILQSLAYLSNREIIFDDKAYFKPFTPTEDELSIDWEPPTDPLDGVTYITTMALSENDDQGSQYLTASQKVVSEAYETTVAISDTTSSYVGQDIKYLAVDDTKSNTAYSVYEGYEQFTEKNNYIGYYIDNDEEKTLVTVSNVNTLQITISPGNNTIAYITNNSRRNTQAKIVALNALIKNFKPGDCIEYSVNETTVPDNNGAEISNWNNFSQVANTDCFLFKVTLPNTNIVATETYYVKENGIWFEYDTDNPLREEGYNVDACVTSITDAHNNITLTDVPLALKTVEYPACVTTYTWGNPEFMDEQSQFNDLAAVSQDTVLDNTSDTGISSGDATKLVVGNQYVHQLRDDRAGFTGLIMEKNLDNNVYRLVGYNQGTIQAQFNSEGKIEAGAGQVVLDSSGLTTYASIDVSQSTPVCYVSSDGTIYGTHAVIADQSTNSDNAKTIGKISNGYVEIDSNGLRTYSNNNHSSGHTSATLQCEVNTQGQITAGGGAIKLDSTGLKAYDGTSSTTIQCEINTQGQITAGGGAIKLDSTGLKAYDGTSVVSSIDTVGQFNSGYVNGSPRISIGDSGLVINSDSSYQSASALHFKYEGQSVGAIRGMTHVRDGGTVVYQTCFDSQNGYQLDQDVGGYTQMAHPPYPYFQNAPVINVGTGTMDYVAYHWSDFKLSWSVSEPIVVRVYASGYKEFFGWTSAVGYDTSYDISFVQGNGYLAPFSTTNYVVNLTFYNETSSDAEVMYVTSKRVDGFTVWVRRVDGSDHGTRYIMWSARGY